MNKVKFTKMHGAGNDFILVDDRSGTFPAHDHLRLAAFAAPRTGVGCEGVILVQQSNCADFKMVFFNPDGTEADMCGNGARCVAQFAREIGAARSAAMTFETSAGLVDAEVISEGQVKVWMPEPKGRRYDINVCGRSGDFIVAGVPHFVVACDNVSAVDVAEEGRALRLADAFSPDGTNVDFVKYIPPNRAVMRTYERGVEAESGACGTGAVAAAIVGVERKGMSLPMRIRTAQGFDVVVDGDWRRSKSTGFTLIGPVKKVFEGEIDLDSLDVSSEME